MIVAAASSQRSTRYAPARGEQSIRGSATLTPRRPPPKADLRPTARHRPLSVTESVGVAVFLEDGRYRTTLIEHADLALYHAKHTGRDRVVTWNESQAAKLTKAI